MDAHRVIRTSSYLLAIGVLLAAALVIGLVNPLPIPDILAQPLDGLPENNNMATIAVFVVLPLILAISVITRATTRSSIDLVLSLIAIPCLLIAIWALYDYFVAHSGVFWGGMLTSIAGVILAIIVIIDWTISLIV